PVLPQHDRGDDNLGILVIDEAAIGTNLTLPVVAIRDEGDRWTARRRRARHPSKCGEVARAPQGARVLKVSDGAARRARAPASDFDVEIGAAVAAVVGVALPALFVWIEFALIALRRRRDALRRLHRHNLLARRRDM